MKVYISVCIIGAFAFSEDNELVDKILFNKNAKEIAEKLNRFDSGQSFEEIDKLKEKYKEHEIRGNDYLNQNLRKIAIKSKFVKNDAELNKLISEVAIERAKIKISKIERRDKLIIHAVSALNDMDKILNSMTERLREWYGLHYPELEMPDHEKFAKAVYEYGKRESFEDFSRSMGMELDEKDIEVLKKYAEQLKEMYKLRKDLEKYLNEVVPQEIPNLNAMLGSLLAARLLAQAGSLEKLAKMPSSTVQLLGAEKSLFKFLRGKEIKNPPKFGILFTHPDISGSKKEFQGKIARLLSSKLTLAARADFYTKRDMSKELLEDYKKKLEEIKSERE